jgi:hypothetical protein
MRALPAPSIIEVKRCGKFRQPVSLCSNPSKYPEMPRKVPLSEYCYLQAFCTKLKTSANLRSALAWRRPRVQVSSGPLRFYRDLQVKRGRLEKVFDTPWSLCAANVQQRGGQPAHVVLSDFNDPYQVTLLDYGVALEEADWYP